MHLTFDDICSFKIPFCQNGPEMMSLAATSPARWYNVSFFQQLLLLGPLGIRPNLGSKCTWRQWMSTRGCREWSSVTAGRSPAVTLKCSQQWHISAARTGMLACVVKWIDALPSAKCFMRGKWTADSDGVNVMQPRSRVLKPSLKTTTDAQRKQVKCELKINQKS